STVLRFTGIGESLLEDRLSYLIQAQNNPTIAPLAQKDGVTIRISAKAKTKQEAWTMIEKVKTRILHIVGDYYYGSDDETIGEAVLSLLQKHDKTLSSAESLTGGLFADKIVSNSGASSVFKGSIVCYDQEIKKQVLRVKSETIQNYGTVSKQCARELAENVRTMLNSSIGLSYTGIAGPNEVEGKEVGTVFIALVDENGHKVVEECFFSGNRQQIRHRTALKGIEMVMRYLKS